MPQAIVKCLQYITGPGRRRQPRSPVLGGYPPGLGPVSCYVQQPPNTYVAGTQFYAPYPPGQFQCGSDPVLKFAFQSVTGLNEGGLLSIDPNNPCQGTVGTLPITVLNVYVPIGGIGEPGAVIDAFNMQTGTLCDDTFVSVVPDDSTGSLTSSGNVYGWVSSAHTESITAYTHIVPSNLSFQNWGIVAGTGDSSDTVSGNLFTLGQGTSPYAFAFYIPPDKSYLENKPQYMDILKSISADYFHFPVDPGDPEYGMLQRISEKLSIFEKQINELGQAFIRISERPAVGKEIAKKGKKR